MEEEEEKKSKKRQNIDWDELFKNDNEAPLEMVVVGGDQSSQSDTIRRLSDYKLNDKIRRLRKNFDELSSRLPDKGAKLQVDLKRHEDERDRRLLLGCQKDADECKKATVSRTSSFSGASNGCSPEAPSSQSHSQSLFTSCFTRRLEGKPDSSTHVEDNAFGKELSYLGRGDRQNVRQNGCLLHKERQGTKVPPRLLPLRSVGSFYKEARRLSNGDQKGIAPISPLHPEENLNGRVSKKRNASEVQSSLDLKTSKCPTVVLVDEEDCPPKATTQQEDTPIGWMKDAKIYYPSRTDPESVELCFSDINCLAPEAFLSSTIMNFYIQHLQKPVFPTSRPRGDYHFFNTYFYKKVMEAVSYKNSDKDTYFVKFRRWWKGVNIFQKAYILLPIHENQHWSLVIICFPDKEDESGPIILHLDSLGYHSSREIFDNIKSYLKEEWKYLSQRVAPPDLPIADKIWRNLPRRIDEKIITVPQQKNDYDCGIFVLFFMERFIMEAPERLKKRDLAMFNKQWFKPEEASGLRERIRKLLLEEFENARMEDFNKESSPTSLDDSPVGSTENHIDS